MAILYKGVGVGGYWHEQDARMEGFWAKQPTLAPSEDRLVQHVARMVVDSPYVSLTASYGIAYVYAVYLGRLRPKKADPAFVYELEISDPLPHGLRLLDPVREISRTAPKPPNAITYHHDGDSEFILGVASPKTMRRFLERPVRHPPPGGGTRRTPNMSAELETLVRSLRDAEILAVGRLPAECVVARHEVW